MAGIAPQDDTQSTPRAPAGPSGSADSGMSLRLYALLVGAGAFATTFAQLRILALYPLTFLLKEHFQLKQEQVAVFFFWATFAWNLKPLAGILTDAFPLFGTRRRHYMMLGAALAGVLWVMMGASAEHLGLLFAFAISLNVATVFASTVMGGLMVEAGQAFGAPGRITSLRQFVQSISQIAAPLLGGYLAKQAFGWTTGIAAGTVIALAILTYFTLHERPRAVRLGAVAALPAGPSPAPEPAARRRERLSPVSYGIMLAVAAISTWLCTIPDTRNIGVSLFALLGVFVLIVVLIFLRTSNAVIVRAQGQLVQIMRSRTLWMGAAMLLLVYTVPGLYTALIYQQSDVLKFDKSFIGSMAALEATFGVIAAVSYGFICRRFPLRVLIVAGVGLYAATTLLYLIYTRQTAPLVHITNGYAFIFAELALMDLSVRSTPRGCEALGFSLMMSMRNFGIGMSDVLATKLVDQFHVSFHSLVLINACTTAVILLFVPLLPFVIVGTREGDKPA